MRADPQPAIEGVPELLARYWREEDERVRPQLVQAFAALEAQQPGRVLELLDAAGAVSSDSRIAAGVRVSALMALRRDEEALAAARALVRAEPEDPWGHFVLGQYLFDHAELEAAADAFAAALERDPDSSHLRSALAQVRVFQSDWDGALALAEEGLRRAPRDPGFTDLAALALGRLGRDREAQALLGAAVARDPADTEARTSLAWLMAGRGDVDAALAQLVEVVEHDPDDRQAREAALAIVQARVPVLGTLSRAGEAWSLVPRLTRMLVLLPVAATVWWVFGWLREGGRPEAAYGLLTGLALAAAVLVAASTLADAFLLLSAEGRRLLTGARRTAAQLTGGWLLLGAGALLLGLPVRPEAGVQAAFACLLAVVPVHAAMEAPAGWPRRAMAAPAGLVALLALLAGRALFSDAQLGAGVSILLLFAAGASLVMGRLLRLTVRTG